VEASVEDIVDSMVVVGVLIAVTPALEQALSVAHVECRAEEVALEVAVVFPTLGMARDLMCRKPHTSMLGVVGTSTWSSKGEILPALSQHVVCCPFCYCCFGGCFPDCSPHPCPLIVARE